MPAHPELAKAALAQSGGSKLTYRWTLFHGKENVTEFDMRSHFALDGHFQSNSSAGHKEYQDRLRAIHLRMEGRTKAEIATILDRSERFVAKWWQLKTKEVPRPNGVHAYLSHGHENPYNNGARSSEGADMDAATRWRDVEVKRGFAKDPDVYQELLHTTNWGADVARTRDFQTGAQNLKYDKEGNIKMQSKQSGKYSHGASPALDRALQKLFAEYGIEDRTSGISVNWYPDGDAMLGSHRHDCWTALFSFGCDRILCIDNTPLLCRDGDLVLFGTQRHGVPLMPEISEGRITVPVFFYPDNLQKKAMWDTIADDADKPTSKTAVARRNASLVIKAVGDEVWSGHADELRQLMQMGFEEEPAKEALRTQRFDVSAAAQVLLNSVPSGADALVACNCKHAAPRVAATNSECDLASSSSVGRWRGRNKALAFSIVDHHASESGAVSSSPSETSMDVSLPVAVGMPDNISASIALALQLEENTNQTLPPGLEDMDLGASASLALAMQMEDEESQQGADPEMLAAQFAQYESELDQADAEDTFKNGEHGDLMASRRARDNLTLEMMDITTLYSIGHGHMSEKPFFELLSLNSIRVLYDLRPTDYRQEIHGISPCFSVSALRKSCKSRGIFYKQMSVGREGAYGTLAHLRSDEAKHILIELLWHAKRRRTAFLGKNESWQQDHRLAIGDLLASHGHTVQHIMVNGACEEHVRIERMPDWLTSEEERLRMLEKQRKAGEVQRPHKASVSRSTEAVAMTLAKPKLELDVALELRAAQNQTQLKFAQQRLARLQRVADEKGALAKGKTLTNVPQFIKDEAIAQAAWSAQRKKEKQALKRPNLGEPQACASPVPESSGDAGGEDLLVQCALCDSAHPWSELASRDGICSLCATLPAVAVPGEPEPLISCVGCALSWPWPLLQLGDGLCPGCFETKQSGKLSAVVGSGSSSSSQSDVASCVAASSTASTALLVEASAPVTNVSSSSWRSRRGKACAGA